MEGFGGDAADECLNGLGNRMQMSGPITVK
jgi:hypothetical protein